MYQKEQSDILYKIIEILNENNQITLYSLDNDVSKQIMSLISDIRKYYSFRDIKDAAEPNR